MLELEEGSGEGNADDISSICVVEIAGENGIGEGVGDNEVEHLFFRRFIRGLALSLARFLGLVL